jgi:hypothetical protein
MSGKLDQSLDEILSSQRRNNQGKRRSQRRTAGTNRPATTAPAGGIQKNAKAARNAAKPTPAKGAGLVGESKIMVSNLVSKPPSSTLQSSYANIVLAQGCFRRPNQGMLLPMRPFLPSDFHRHLSSAACLINILSWVDDEGDYPRTSVLEATVMMPTLLLGVHIGITRSTVKTAKS